MIATIFSFVAAAVLLIMLVAMVRREHSEKRRVASNADLAPELCLPFRYKSLTQLENFLWEAAVNSDGERSAESARLSLPPRPLSDVRNYLRGLREDFDRGNRIFSAILRHSPQASLLAKLERQRLGMQLSFRFWLALIQLRLLTHTVSVAELRKLTDVVATLAYQIRTLLASLRQSGNADLVDSILRNA